MNEADRATDLIANSRAYPERQGGLIDVREVIQIFRRRFPLILFTVCLVMMADGLFLALSPRIYTASATILLDSRKEKLTRSESVLSELPANSDVADTETELLHSRVVAEQVVRTLGLASDPEFVGRSSLVRRSPGAAFRAATEQVLKHASVSRVGLSYVMVLSVRSFDPVKAARIANVWARAYVDAKTNESLSANTRAIEFLKTRLNDLYARMIADDEALQQFKVRHHLLSGDANSLNEQEASTYNDNFAQAQTTLAQDEARLKAAREQVARGSNGEDVGEALSSPVIQNLRARLAEEGANVAALRNRYGPRHPELQQAQQQLADTSAQLQAEIRRIISSLEAQLAASRQAAAAIQASRAGAHSALALDNEALVQEHGLETAKESSALVYSAFLSRYKETTSQQGITASDVRIASPAEPPLGPSFPQPALVLAAGLALAITGACAASVLAEALDQGMAGKSAVERLLRLTFLGGIAQLQTVAPSKIAKACSPAEFLLRSPQSAFAESIRAITSALLRSDPARPVQIVAILSAQRGEGRTTTAHCIAQSAAIAGLSAVVVGYESFPRQGPQARQIDGAVTSRTIGNDRGTSYDFISLADLNRLRLLTEPEVFVRALQPLRDRYRLIIIDGPPVLTTADALNLGRVVDRVVLVAKWRATRHDQAGLAARLIQEAGGLIAGVVLSMVHAGKLKRFAGHDGSLYSEH